MNKRIGTIINNMSKPCGCTHTHTHTHTHHSLKNEKNEGITLIALVITIIVLLILVGVSIAMLTGENGILSKATQAKETNALKAAEEKVKLAVMASYGEDGKINPNTLKDNLEAIDGIEKSSINLDNLKEYNENNDNTTTVTVDGQEIVLTLTANNTVTVEAKNDQTSNSTEPSTPETPEEPNPPKEPVIHTVKLNANGGTIKEGENVTSYIQGQEISLPTNVTKEGYGFSGWYEATNFIGDRTTKISATDEGDKTYYAKWNFGPMTGSYTRTDASNYPKTMQVLDVSDMEKIKVLGGCSNGASVYFNTGGWNGTSFAGEELHSHVSGSFEVELDVKNYSEVYLLHAGSKDSMVSYTVTKPNETGTISVKNQSDYRVYDISGYKTIKYSFEGSWSLGGEAHVDIKKLNGESKNLFTAPGVGFGDFDTLLTEVDVAGYNELEICLGGNSGSASYTVEYVN